MGEQRRGSTTFGRAVIDWELVTAARNAVPTDEPHSDLTAALQWAAAHSGVVEGLGDGDTWRYLQFLATCGAVDLTLARVVEPHLDAVAILSQAGQLDLVLPGGTWGVYAASAPGLPPLQAQETSNGLIHLNGTKPWCSLASELTHALVTAQGPHGGALYAVDLRQSGVHVSDGGAWVSRGLRRITSTPVTFESVAATPVGPPGWYLDRPGFWWGALGVAAVWLGASVAVATRALEAASRRPPDQVALMHLGTLDVHLSGAAVALRQAAATVDAGEAQGAHGQILATRLRSHVAGVAEEVLRTVGHALGPAPLTSDAEHVRRVADLTVYLRQHHAERDLAALGKLVLEQE